MIDQGYIKDIKSAFIRSAFLFFRLLRGMLGAVLTMGPLTLTWDWDRFVPYLGTHARSQSQTNRRDCPQGPWPITQHPSPFHICVPGLEFYAMLGRAGFYLLLRKGREENLEAQRERNRIIHLSLGHRKKNISLSLQADEENSSI